PQPVSFSAGIAWVEGEVDDVMREVDVALYAAKTAGRDRWAWAEAGSRPTTTTDRATQVVERPSTGGFVAHSRLSVPEGGRDELVSAFDERLRLVERWPGFKHLEVWADRQDPTEFVMVSWWDREEDFRAYMASEDHRRSHARIPGGQLRPRPETFRRFEIITR
ncbi:MAG: antibiotic biosynthesis monooxygenase, partial [Actinomycetota bacterium]